MFIHKQSHSNRKQFCKAELQQYVGGVFYNKLSEDGFVSYNDEGLSWYRLRNKDVIQTVFFHVEHCSSLLLPPKIGYGTHSLFTPAPIPFPIRYHFGNTYDEYDREITETISALGRYESNDNFANTYPGTIVMCSPRDKQGLEKYEECVLPLFERCKTLDDCYAYHKNNVKERVRELQKFKPEGTPQRYDWLISDAVSVSFIDEALYLEDQDIYPLIIEAMAYKMSSYAERLEKCAVKVLSQWYVTQLRLTEAQQNALLKGEIQSWKSHLEERKRKFSQVLHRKLNL